MSNVIKVIKFKPKGEKVEIVSKRGIWEAIKKTKDGFLIEACKAWEPVAIETGGRLWKKAGTE